MMEDELPATVGCPKILMKKAGEARCYFAVFRNSYG